MTVSYINQDLIKTHGQLGAGRGGGGDTHTHTQHVLLSLLSRHRALETTRRGVSPTGLVSGGEPGPGLIRPPVVVLGVRHLHVVTELEDLGLPQLLHRGPLAQLQRKH